MKKIIALAAALLTLCSCGIKPSEQAGTASKRYSAEIYGAFDTVIIFTAYCENKDDFEKIYNEVSLEFMEMHRLFDRYDTYPTINNIKTINDSAGKTPVEVDRRITELLEFASQMYISTDGALNIMMGNVFDLWRNSRDNGLPPPSVEKLEKAAEGADISHLIINKERSAVFINSGDCSIDVGAVAKGFAVDKVTQILEKKKISNFLINCGSSSIRASGRPQDKEAWNVGIRKPFEFGENESDGQQLISTVGLIDSCIGTSGDYQNYYQYDGKIYHHLIDPQTLYPAKNYRAVTVLSDSCAVADALSTAVFVSSEGHGNELADMYEARIIRIDKSMTVSEYKGEKKMQSFDGGISLGSLNRKNTHDSKVSEIIPQTVRLPVSCARAEVKQGERVKVGQLIASGAVNVYSSVAGEVEKLDRGFIKIKNNFTDETIEHEALYEDDLDKIDGEKLLELLRKYSILGMGGAEFPAYRKYSTEKKIRTVVINGCECEPYLTCDHALMRDNPELVILGAAFFKKIVNAEKIILCIEEHSRDVAEKFSSVEVRIFPDRYPQGSEKIISVAGFESEIPYGGFPDDLGLIISNAATCAAFASAVLSGIPPVSRIVTVDGNVKKPGNFKVPFGTPVSELIKAGGGFSRESAVITGGPMTGRRITDLSTPVTYGTNGVIAVDKVEVQTSACIRCGGCVRVCPTGLTPFRIEEEFLAGRYSGCKALRAEQCISCGCCSFICPAKRELAYNVTRAKQKEAEDERAVFEETADNP